MYQQLSSRGKTLFWIITILLWAMLFAPIIISSNTLFPFQVGKAIYYRIIVEVILFLYIWLALLEPAARPKKTWLTWSVIAFFAVLLTSTVFSVNAYRSFWGDIERMEGVFGILHGGALFLVLYGIFKRKEDWLWFFKISLAVSIFTAIYSLRQKYGSGVFEAGAPAPGSTLGNPAFNSTYAIFHIFFAAFIVWWDRARWWKIFAIGALALNTVVLFLTAIRGGQVGLFASLFVMALFYVLWGAHTRKARMAAVSFLVLLIALPFALFALRDTPIIKKLPVALQRIAAISLERDPTINTRLISVGISWDAFKEKPLLGFGPEHFRVGYNKHFNPEHLTFEQAWFDRAHNKISDVAVMTGGLGLLTYLGMFGVAFFGLLRTLRTSHKALESYSHNSNAAIEPKASTAYGSTAIIAILAIGLGVAYFVQNIFLFDMPMSYMLFFSSLGFAGYLIGSHTAQEAIKPYSHSSPKSSTAPMAYGSKALGAGSYVLLLGVGVFVVYLIVAGNIQPYRSASWGREGLGLAQLQNGSDEEHRRAATQGLEAYKKALAIGGYPGSEVMRVMTDSILNSAGARQEEWNDFFAYTVSEMEKFLETEPLDPRQFIRLGKVYNEHSFLEPRYLTDAERNLRFALELVPKRPDAYYELGVTYLQAGDNERGIQQFRDALALNPDNARAHWTLGIALQIVGKQEEGLVSLERAIELGYGWQNTSDINNLAVIYNSLNQKEKAIQVYTVAVGIYPTNVQYHINLANLYKDIGDVENARRAALKAVELDPSLEAAVGEFIAELE